jgi:spermidine/putrescine ABC transporter ATP-binding subunit
MDAEELKASRDEAAGASRAGSGEFLGAELVLRGLTKSFGAVRALRGVDLTVRPGELVAVLGPSGSGKTTLLQTVAGYELPDEGAVLINAKDVTFLSPARREIGMVFQNYALFPHLTVAGNIAFPLKMRRLGGRAIADRVTQALDLVRLSGYGARYPRELSGGQQQRVALARALVFRPCLLLLDEPFGALDRKLRDAMQLELRRLHQQLGVTTLFITHDQDEALLLGDRVAVMRDGAIEQVAQPATLYAAPATRFVAEFIGESNILTGTVAVGTGAGAVMEGPDGLRIAVHCERQFAPGARLSLLLRPEALRPVEGAATLKNILKATVTERIYLGIAHRYRVRTGADLQLQLCLPCTPGARVFEPGDTVAIGWNPEDAHILEIL